MDGIFLGKLDMPPALKTAVQQIRQSLGSCSAYTVVRLEDNLKLRYYFGGLDVACLETPEGKMVVASGLAGTGEVRERLQSLPADILPRVTLLFPEPWVEMPTTPVTNK